MRKLLVFGTVTGWLFTGLVLPSVAAIAPAPDEQTILQIEREACEAYLHADAAYLDKLLTDDFTAINGRAEINDKKQELQEVRDKSIHFTVFENRDMQVHQHGDMAAVVGITTVKGAFADGKTFAVEVRFTDVFAKVAGQWRMVAGHSSRFPAKES